MHIDFENAKTALEYYCHPFVVEPSKGTVYTNCEQLCVYLISSNAEYGGKINGSILYNMSHRLRRTNYVQYTHVTRLINTQCAHAQWLLGPQTLSRIHVNGVQDEQKGLLCSTKMSNYVQAGSEQDVFLTVVKERSLWMKRGIRIEAKSALGSERGSTGERENSISCL